MDKFLKWEQHRYYLIYVFELWTFNKHENKTINILVILYYVMLAALQLYMKYLLLFPIVGKS
jgi:hypothetical protein